MTRPYVQITTSNQIVTLRRHLDALLPWFITFDGIVGITLNGGMSRGYADHFSEIDITFYLETETFQAWESGKSPTATGITVLNGQLYDIKYVSYAGEETREWETVALWDASYAEILYDTNGRIHKLISEKLQSTPDIRLVERFLMSCWWYYALAGEIWIHRGDTLQGHHMFNQAVHALLQALFIANGEYIPHEKWLLHMSRSLEWKPANWESRLGTAMSTGDLTIESLKTRQAAIQGLWEDIDVYIIETYHPHLPVHMMQKTTYEQLRLLFEAGSMSIPEWQTQTGQGVPNGDPFYPVIRLDSGRIILDRDALLKIEPQAMYSWHYDVLQAVAAEYRIK